MSAPNPQDDTDVADPSVELEAADELWFIDESIAEAPLAAAAEAKFDRPARPPLLTRAWFVALVAVTLIIHAALIAAFLYRDARQPTQVAQIQETPVEVVVEKPPEPEPPKPLPPPPPPKPPEPEKPRPKEDLSPALSAPRAPTEDKVQTQTKEAKTAAPTKMETPTQGQPKAAPEAAAPPKEAPAVTPQKEEATKEEDKTKPDAEALDRAKKAAKAKESKSKVARAQPKRKAPSALAMLAGAPSLDTSLSFAKPTPKTKIYGGTEDVRWMSQVEAMLEAKVTKLPRTAHWRDGGRVVIFFHVDVSGRVIAHDIILKSGYPDIDQIAMRALTGAAPFPPPPPGLERGLYWASTFDGVVPDLHISKR